MALLLCSNPLSFLSTASSPSFSSPSPVLRLNVKALDPCIKSLSRVQICRPVLYSRRCATIVVKASLEIDGTASEDGGEPPSDSNKEVVPVDKIPLESKLQERMEQKMRMKLAKKIRLRRKRLLRKRKMRKKGRWPPSKMKKLKNV